MCKRIEILNATDVVTTILDELTVSGEEVAAVVTVLGLLGRLLEQKTTH